MKPHQATPAPQRSHRREIADELERAFFRAYPELAGRVRRARAAPAPPACTGARWRACWRAALTAAALLLLVWLAPRHAAGAVHETCLRTQTALAATRGQGQITVARRARDAALSRFASFDPPPRPN